MEQLRRAGQSEENYGAINRKFREVPTNFEEAVALAGTGRFHNVLLLVCGLSMMAVMFEIFSTSFLLPAAQCDFKFSLEEKGLLNSMCIMGMVCSSHMWGYLADTRGRRKVLIIALLLDCTSTILSAFAHAFWLFLVLRFFSGFFVLAPSTVLYAYLGEFHTAKTRSKAIVWVCIFIGIGLAIQPGIAWLVLPQTWTIELPWCTFNSWRAFVLLCTIPGLLSAFLLTMWFPESPKFLMVVNKKEEALKVLSSIYSQNSGNSPQRFPVQSLVLHEDGSCNPAEICNNSVLAVIKHMWQQTVPLLLPPFLLKTLLVCSIQFGLYASANGLSLWMPDIFNHMAEYSDLHSGDSEGVCAAYAFSVNNSISESNLRGGLFSTNDTITFTCTVDQVILKFNNETRPLSDGNDIIQCKNGSLLIAYNDRLLLNVINDSTTISVLNETMRNLLFSKHIICNADVDFSVFQNAFILGVVNAVALYIIGHLIGPFSKKTILVTNLTIGGTAGVVMNYVTTMWGVFVVAGIFVTFSGMCISVLVSTVVDIFPTHLRAMAVCLSLMTGRLGSVCVNMLMGVLLDVNCYLMIYIMGGICISCGLLSLLLPSPKST